MEEHSDERTDSRRGESSVDPGDRFSGVDDGVGEAGVLAGADRGNLGADRTVDGDGAGTVGGPVQERARTGAGLLRPDERRGGNECVSTCRYRGSQYNEKKKITKEQ